MAWALRDLHTHPLTPQYTNTPNTNTRHLLIPTSTTKNTVAEKTFRNLAELSTKYKGIRCIAVSHSSEDATERWVEQVGGEWEVRVLVDEARDLYAAWGLGLGSYWSVWNPRIIASAVRLSQTDRIANRTTESGSRWQTGGAFAVDAMGVVRWAQVASSADEIPDLTMALVALRVPGAGR